MTQDSDPRTVIVAHGDGARVCIEAILDIQLPDIENIRRQITRGEARDALLAIAAKQNRADQARAARMNMTRFSTVACWLEDLELVRQVREKGKAGRGRLTGWEPDWLGVSKYIHEQRKEAMNG